MKINNTTQIRADDFEEDHKRTAEQLANILNPFMQQVQEITDNRIDFENRVENYIEIEMTVDASGKPILNNKISTGKSNIRGFQVIAAFGASNANITATEHPFISFTPIGGGLVEVSSITGLPANTKMRLNVIVY